MFSWPLSRATHFYAIAARQIWLLFYAGIFGVVGSLVTWRDEIFPPEIAHRYRVLLMIPHWDWGWWALVVAVIVIVVMVDGSYRINRELKRRIEELSVRPTSDLAIAIREGMGLIAETRVPLPTTKAFMVRVKNIGNNLLRNCQVALRDEQLLYYVSTSFDLKIDENEDVPIIHIPLVIPEMPEVRPLSKEDKLPSYSCVLDEGTYEVKVFSDDSYPCSMAVRLCKKGESWVLTQCV